MYDATKPVTLSTLVSADMRGNFEGLRASLWGRNLIRDNRGYIWAAGDSSSPTHYSRQAGAGSAIARETGTVYGGVGTSFKLTGATAAAEYLQQTVLSSTSFLPLLQGKYFSLGGAVRAGALNSARIGIYDGVGDTTWSEYAGWDEDTSAAEWEWVTVVKQLNAAADRLVIRMQTAQGVISYFAVPDLRMGDAPPAAPVPSIPALYRPSPGTRPGTLAIETTLNGWRDRASLPWIAINTELVCGTAPATSAIIVDANKNGSSMYSTRPQIAASATSGAAAPDHTYANRCFAVGDNLTLDVDQIGTGTVGADLTPVVVGLCFFHPFLAWLGPTGLSETGAEA